MTEIKRGAQRMRTFKGGRINPDGQPGVDCVVRNLSETGACLEVGSSLVGVDEFNLVIMPEYLTRRCHVVWRKPQKIGVHFASTARLTDGRTP